MRAVDRADLQWPAVDLAPLLLGAVVESEVGGSIVAVRLTEVEAYEGSIDPASHAFRGPTPRTKVMFGPAGHLYTYFTYGMHWCANIVCGTPGSAAAVLLRAGEVVHGADIATVRRPAAKSERDLARGPARLASALGLNGKQNGIDLCTELSTVRLIEMPAAIGSGIRSGPRVGITVGVDRPWRFWLADEPTVSTFRLGKPRKSDTSG